MITGVTIQFNGSLYSEEHKQRFNTENSTAQIAKSKDSKLNLTIDGTKITDWFKHKWSDLRQSVNIKKNRSKGFKM